jgi:integrase
LVGEINLDNAETWFKEIRKAGCSFKVGCDVARSLTTCLKYAVKKQYIEYVGALAEWSPKEDKALLPKERAEYTPNKTPMINRQEVSRLLDHLTPRNNEDIKSIQKYVCISTLAFLGLRMSELIALKWSSVNLDTGRWEVTHTIVSGHYARSVKADGSERNNLLPNELWKMLKAWKIVHNKFFGKKCEWLFPSFGYHDVAITEKVVRDWLLLAYADLGLAEVEIRKSKSGDNKAYLKIKSCKFKGGPSKTFRHFASTALMNQQKADPVILNDNFIKDYIGHTNIKMTRHYADHNNLDEETVGHLDKERAAIDNALRINTSDSWSKFTEN